MHAPRTLTLTALALLLAPVSLDAQSVAYDITAARQSTGLAFFDGDDFAGIASIQYGAPEWKADYDALVASDRSGTFRLGKDAWATLEAGLPLAFGETNVLPDHYALALRRDAEGEFALLLLDPDQIRRERVLPNQPDAIEPTAALRMTYAKVDEVAKQLTIRMTAAESDARKGVLTVHWGTHRLSSTWTAPRANARKLAFDASIAGMISLLDSKNYEQLIRTYAEPEFVAEHEDEIAQIVKEFEEGSDKPERIRTVLLEVQKRNVEIGADQERILLEVEGAPGDEVGFCYADGRWHLLDR